MMASFFGDAENEEFNKEVNRFINHVIVPEARKVGLDCFEGIGNHSKWNKTIERIFQHRKLKSWNQRVYMLEKRIMKIIMSLNLNRDILY